MSSYSVYLFRSPLNENGHVNYLSKVLNEIYQSYGSNIDLISPPGAKPKTDNKFVNSINAKMPIKNDLFKKKFGRNPRNPYENELKNALNRWQ